jgi:putative peptide zinc metalloprotease protein
MEHLMERTAIDLLEACPRATGDCRIERQDGAGAYVLRDAEGLSYTRLSEEGLFLWQLIDGERTVRDLCRAYAVRYGRQATHEAMSALSRLGKSRLIRFEDRDPHERCPSGRAGSALRWCSWHWWVGGLDPAATALYRALRPICAPIAQAALLIAALAGLMAFARHLAVSPWPTVALLPAALSLLLHIAVHEAAHALTCKHFGREVRRAGIGWYYFAPVAFVATSDIWPAPRLQRILVSAAGPYSNLVLSGLAALGTLALAPGDLTQALWQFSAVGYVLALLNLNPLIELDGYYIVMDLLELPNLRKRALATLGAAFARRPFDDGGRRPILLAFGAASLAYAIAMLAGIMLAGRGRIENLSAAALPHPCAEAIAWLAAGALGLLVLKQLYDDLRGRPFPRA